MYVLFKAIVVQGKNSFEGIMLTAFFYNAAHCYAKYVRKSGDTHNQQRVPTESEFQTRALPVWTHS